MVRCSYEHGHRHPYDAYDACGAYDAYGVYGVYDHHHDEEDGVEDLDREENEEDLDREEEVNHAYELKDVCPMGYQAYPLIQP